MKQELIQQFYNNYQAKLLCFAKAILRSEMDAEEAVHNVFRKLAESGKGFDIKKPYPYLIQCTKFEAYAILKKTNKDKEVNFNFISDNTENNNESRSEEDSLHLLRKALETLPTRCKEIMLLKLDEGLTHAEISEYLKVSEKTVENQVTIAFAKIRKYLVKI